MQKVYAVWRGEYSDYRIVAIFSTQEKAQECCAVFNDAGVTEYELDSFDEGKELHKYKVYITDDMAHSPDYVEDSLYSYIPNTIQRVLGLYLMIVLAKNIEHARKVAADKYAMFKAAKDTHFPLIDKECICSDSYVYRYSYPVYDMTTFEILLSDRLRLEQGYEAATRNVGKNG